MLTKKNVSMVVVVLLLCLLVGVVIPSLAQIILNWFTLEVGGYNGPNTVSVDFYYFEDAGEDEDTYLGTINIIHDGQEADDWYVDEYVDLIPYTDQWTGETLTEDEIFEGMEYFADGILLMLNMKEDNWPFGAPQGFYTDDGYWEIVMDLDPVIYDKHVYLPIVVVRE